jgi:hypothetical protein
MRWLLRITGLFSLLLFLTPTFYVLKYYSVDSPREARRAARIAVTPVQPTPSLNSIAPPLSPIAPGNAADFYTRAIQSYATHTAASSDPHPAFPRPDEVSLLFEGARRADCQYFPNDSQGQPEFVFHDPTGEDATEAYRYPLSAQEKYLYLGMAGALAQAVAHAAATASPDDRHQQIIGQALVRFGDSLGRERATRTHLEVAYAIQKMGLGLLRPFGGASLEHYVDALQIYEESVQAKYALLEPVTPDNIALQEKVALHDADPMWRREAVWALGATLTRPGLSWQRPIEALTGKATLAQVATQDSDLSVRAAASETLGSIAQHGAVIRR